MLTDKDLNPMNLPELIGARVAVSTTSVDQPTEPAADENFKYDIDFVQREDHIGYSYSQIAQDL